MRLDLLLYTFLAFVISILCFLAVQAVAGSFGGKRAGVHTGLATRLTLVHECLLCFAEAKAPAGLLRKQLQRYARNGTGRLRIQLSKSGYTRAELDEYGLAIALVGNMVQFTMELIDEPALLPGTPDRIRSLAVALAGLRDSLAARALPQTILLPAPQHPPARFLPFHRLEYTTAILSQIFSSRLIADLVPAMDPAPNRYLRPDAFQNPAYLRFALRTCLAATTAYLFYSGVNAPGLSVALSTCIVTSLTSPGASHQKQILRILGSSAGGILALLAQIWFLPRFQSIGGFLVALTVATFLATWIYTSGPRIAYAGRQMALTYDLVHLSEPFYNVSLAAVRDRLLGVLLGLVCMWLIFDQLWSGSSAQTMRTLFVANVRRIAAFPTRFDQASRAAIVSVRDEISTSFEGIRSAADAVLLEFEYGRPQNLEARNRVRSWQPLIRTLYVLRLALLRRDRINSPGARDPRVDEAVRVSSGVLAEVGSLLTAPSRGFRRVPSSAIPIPSADPEDNDSVKIATSMIYISVYLREQAALDVTTTG